MSLNKMFDPEAKYDLENGGKIVIGKDIIRHLL